MKPFIVQPFTREFISFCNRDFSLRYLKMQISIQKVLLNFELCGIFLGQTGFQKKKIKKKIVSVSSQNKGGTTTTTTTTGQSASNKIRFTTNCLIIRSKPNSYDKYKNRRARQFLLLINFKHAIPYSMLTINNNNNNCPD